MTAVLVVVDVQNGFVTEVSRPVVPVIRDLVGKWQAAGAPTVFTRFFNYRGSPFERLVKWNKLMESPETDIVPELAPLAEKSTEVLDKQVYTALTEQGRAMFERYGWTDIYLCGIDTESCVLKTAADAFELGLTPWVIADACASHSSQYSHEAGLHAVGKFIGAGQIVSTSDLASAGAILAPEEVPT